MPKSAAQTGHAGPGRAGQQAASLRAARRRGVSRDTLLQVCLALLGVVLSALAWLPLLTVAAPGG